MTRKRERDSQLDPYPPPPTPHPHPRKKILTHQWTPSSELTHQWTPQEAALTHQWTPQGAVWTHQWTPQGAVWTHQWTPQGAVWTHQWFVCLLVGCLTSQQHASVSQGRICTDNVTCCHTEIEAADQTFHLTQSQYTDTGPTSPSADPITPGAWQGSHWSANV